jgi:hypothetical protein
MELINIYRGTEVNRRRSLTFLPNGTACARIVCTREHSMDYEDDILVIPSVKDGPEFTADQAFLAARSTMFGLRLDAIDTPAEVPPPPAKRKRKSHANEQE